MYEKIKTFIKNNIRTIFIIVLIGAGIFTINRIFEQRRTNITDRLIREKFENLERRYDNIITTVDGIKRSIGELEKIEQETQREITVLATGIKDSQEQLEQVIGIVSTQDKTLSELYSTITGAEETTIGIQGTIQSTQGIIRQLRKTIEKGEN